VVVGAALCIAVLIGSATAQVVVNPVSGHKYEYVRVRGFINWEQARDAALSRGGYLATITDSLETRIVVSLLAYPGQKAFLGATDAGVNCKWRWVTDEPWIYQNWAPGEPGGEEPCENSLRTSYELGGKWDADVGPLDGYIVERNAISPEPLLSPHQWSVAQGGSGHWYAYLPSALPWDQARQAASQFVRDGVTGHLATITSQEENDFVFAHIIRFDSLNPQGRVGNHWLGGYDDTSWTWVDGESFEYANWGYGQPDHTTWNPVVAMVGPPWPDCLNCPQPGEWVAQPRDLLLGSIVEFETPTDTTLVDLVQWPVSEGGNGHWYACMPSEMTWDQARTTANQFEKDGVAGHLATVTSQEENNFIFSNLILPDSVNLFGRFYCHWLGGHDDTLWTWVTGEPFIYTNWGYGFPYDATAHLAVTMLGLFTYVCLNCPVPSQWVTQTKDYLLSSIVEFDGPPIEPRTLLVPEEYPTIQIAINAARNGDRVLVGPGTYYESINFRGKNITVRGADGPLHTAITNERMVNLVTFDRGETHDAVLEGFTLSGGWIAVLCVNSAPTIRRNICVGQQVSNWAAICLSGPVDTAIDQNGEPRYGAHFGDAPAVIVNNTIVNSTNGGISSFSIAPPTIWNNIIAFNAHYGIHHQGGGQQQMPLVGYNDVYGNGNANYYNIPDPGPGSISVDPLFDNRPLVPNYTLLLESPCINAGDPNPRFNDPDGSRNDMGAMPFFGGGGGIIPTNEWIIVFCDNLRPDVVVTPESSLIQAFDPNGVLCGQAIRYWEGSYGFMPVYRDDPYTEVDEGCEPGDLIQFKIDGMPVQPSTPVYWTANGDVFEVCDFGANRCLNIPLHTGWNLISWNVAFEGAIHLALEEIIGCVDVVHSYEQGGLTFDPQLDLYNTLTHVDYHHGYWIRMNCDAVLQVCGDEIPFEEWIALEPGWNLVSYWPPQPLPIEQGFNSILDSLQEAMGFDNGALVWLPTTPYLNTLVELKPTFGYWTKVPGFMPLYYPAFLPFPDTLPWPWPPDSGFVEVPPLAETSRNWMSVYGDNITIDGQPLSEGAVISFSVDETVICGRGVYQAGALRLTPVYGHDGSGEVSKLYPEDGDQLAVFVDGQRVYPDLKWASNGARVRLSRLTADNRGLPQEYALAQNYPNPFNPGTMVAFDVPADGHVNVSIFNVLGQKVRTLVDRDCAAGRYEQEWDSRDDNGNPISTGVYFYRLTAGEQVLTKKMMLLK
jgi:hypothetical protein